MLGRTNTGGGGSGGLNFQVIGGTTAPSNPKENMIWVNTSTKITSYIFSATQPTGSAGMVWISTGTSSTVKFNALKKNGILVYPISAKQYVSGAWVDKTVKSYQGGKWVKWINGILIYENGIQYKPLERVSGTATFDTTYITLSVNGSSSRVATVDKIDLTNFKTVTVDYSNKTSVAEIAIKIMSDRDNVITRQNLRNTTSGNLSCDISSVTGDCYVEIQLYNENSASVRINKIEVLK